MYVKNKYKVHALTTTNRAHPISNDTFYESRADAHRRAVECIRGGCEAIVIYRAEEVLTPTRPEVESHGVE